MSRQAVACIHCGQPIAGQVVSRQPPPISYGNDSGTGTSAVIPQELRGFNFGAMLMGFFWSIFHNSWFGLLCGIPYAGFIMAIILGIKGNEWAWQNRKWGSIEQFRAVQRKWEVWGLVFWGSVVLIAGVSYAYLSSIPPATPIVQSAPASSPQSLPDLGGGDGLN